MSKMIKSVMATCVTVWLVGGISVAKEKEEEPLVKAPPFNNRVGLARAAYQSGDNERAIRLYTEALGMRSSVKARRIALIRRGNAYVDSDQPDKGIADFNEALRLGACEACVDLDRGIAFEQKGQIDKALAELTRGIQSDPGYASLYYDRGSLYFDEKQYENALADQSKAVELTPNDVDTRIARAKSYIRLHRNDIALADLDVAVQLDPQSTRAFVARAEAYVQKANFPRAKKEIDAAKASLPGDNVKSKLKKYAFESLAWFLATSPGDALRDGKQAVTHAKKACDLDNWKNWAFVSALAASCAEAGNFDDAIKYQRRLLRMIPPHRRYVADEKERLALYENHQPYRDVIKP